jgi:adenine-specific DNA-methyltransferase
MPETKQELIQQIKALGLKNYSGKKVDELKQMIQNATTVTPKSDDYVYQSMLTCIGNKRKLIPHIINIVKNIQHPKLNIVDGFAGSGVVSRALLPHANELYTNDLEYYSYLMSYCYLKTPSKADQERIQHHIHEANHLPMDKPGIICKLYAPQDTDNIQPGERCFYTRENALRIDTIRQYIHDHVETHLQPYILAPLLVKASIHTNTAGVFKGFYKDDTKGCFGGKGKNALSRILKPITLDMPIWLNEADAQVNIFNENINTWIHTLPNNIDIMYLDPPYNQHPYGSNYFMLNVIARNEEPSQISNVSGIPANWNKSVYNAKQSAIHAMRELFEIGLSKSKYLVVSYNNEGIIPLEDWNQLLQPYIVEKHEIVYDTFKGSRNLRERDNKVVEIIYVIHK